LRIYLQDRIDSPLLKKQKNYSYKRDVIHQYIGYSLKQKLLIHVQVTLNVKIEN